MGLYKIVYVKHAVKDAQKLTAAGLDKKARALISLLEADPFQTPPPCEKLCRDLSGFYSRRINIQHRLVYEVLPNSTSLKDNTGAVYKGIVKVARMWSHYE